ncbi:hypothetical protein BDQ17DRAFT_1544613 [Cyathus striatus]|nr:hypothetical protein BDQ17DRAFT_1544613 [Cyathus striatus]
MVDDRRPVKAFSAHSMEMHYEDSICYSFPLDVWKNVISIEVRWNDLKTSMNNRRWVPGHTGVRGNEHADAEAKRAITEGSSALDLLPAGLKHPLPANTSALRAHHHSQMTDIITTSWRASPRYHRINRLFPGASLKRICSLMFTLPRKLSTLLVHLVSDHNALHSHLYLIGKTSTNLCPSCHCSPETTDHYFFLYPTYNTARRTLASQCSLPIRCLTLGALLSLPKRIAALFRYVNAITHFRCTLGTLPE